MKRRPARSTALSAPRSLGCAADVLVELGEEILGEFLCHAVDEAGSDLGDFAAARGLGRVHAWVRRRHYERLGLLPRLAW